MALAQIVPVMTGYSAPEGVASADGEYNSSAKAYYAFDGDFESSWLSLASQPSWLKYQFSAARTVSKYGILPYYINYSPTEWKLQGSNDNSAWTDLDSRTGQTLSATAFTYYTVTTPGSYRYYRLYFTATAGANLASIRWWTMFADTVDAPASPSFSGITGLSDNGDGTLTASWGSASNHSFFRVHLHTSSLASGETTYLVAEAKSTATSCRIGNLAGSATKLTAGTTYYVMVEAVSSGGTVDGNSVNLTAAPTNPNASGAIGVVIPAPTPVALAGTETTIYTCPAGKAASVKCVHLANIDSSARTVTIYKVKSGDSAADDTTLAKTRSLGAAGDATAEDYLGPFTLAAGDKISGLCSSASKVTATAEVVEVTL